MHWTILPQETRSDTRNDRLERNQVLDEVRVGQREDRKKRGKNESFCDSSQTRNQANVLRVLLCM